MNFHWIYEWRLSKIRSKIEVPCPRCQWGGEVGWWSVSSWRGSASRGWMLAEQVREVYDCVVRSLHQSLSGRRLASPSRGRCSVNHQPHRRHLGVWASYADTPATRPVPRNNSQTSGVDLRGLDIDLFMCAMSCRAKELCLSNRKQLSHTRKMEMEWCNVHQVWTSNACFRCPIQFKWVSRGCGSV